MVMGGVPARRPDQAMQVPQSGAGTGPAPQTNNQFREVIISGIGGGLFVYNTTRTQLLESIAGAATIDPVTGTTVPAGTATYNSHGRVINLLSVSNDAFFQYADAGAAQGALILAVASTSGTDPIDSTAYGAGMTGIDPAFGDSIVTVGANITLAQVAYTRAADISAFTGSVGARPGLRLDAPEQTTASHLQMLMQGESPNGANPAQLLLGAVSGAALLSAASGSTIETQASSATQSALSGVEPSLPAGSLGLDIRISGDTAARAVLTAGFTGVGGGLTTGNGTGASDTLFTRASSALWVASQTAATQPGTTATAETRHAFTGANSWAVAAGFPWFYELLLSGEVRIQGTVVIPVGFAANQAMASAVPAAYRPSYNGPTFNGFDTTANLPVWIYMSSGGVLTLMTAPLPALVAGHNISIPGQTYSVAP